MSHDTKTSILLASPREFFVDRIDEALVRLKFDPLPSSKTYLADLLHHFIFSKNLFETDAATGKSRRETLAELFLRAQNSPPPMRSDLLKRLGDHSLYISGFYGDSLNRKIVDIDYYVDMGGVAYGALSSAASNEEASAMFNDFSKRFVGFVDVLIYISQDTRVQSNEDLLRLYDRYLATGSRLAEEQLLEKGLLNADIQKSKSSKM
jgi:hypothetical protein